MNKDKCKSNLFGNMWLRHREMGNKPKIGSQDRFMQGLYTSMLPFTSWDHSGEGLRGGIPGGIFNLEFSPDGSLLVAACEKKNILMFDPLSRRLIHTVDNAHSDCVNCIRFLDSRVFATCSDDSTVALWDARHLKTRIRELIGHSNWVKNIEYSQKDSLLVTSGFDGKIYTWDINSDSNLFNEVFHTNGLMRSRLNPDASKMIICTTGGYLILIHDLDLKRLAHDVSGFKPNVYRLMQISQSTIPVAASFTHLFSRKRKCNRIEFITDFPENDEAEVVSSLQVHPHGWCALSRNITSDESTEWTCVHDIQEMNQECGDISANSSESSDDEGQSNIVEDISSIVVDNHRRLSSILNDVELRESGLSIQTVRNREQERDRVNRRQEQERHRVNRRYEQERDRVSRRSHSASGSSPYFRGFPSASRLTPFTSTDVWEALVAIREIRTQRERAEAESRLNGMEISLNPDSETRMRIVRMASGFSEARRFLEERRLRANRRSAAANNETINNRERDDSDDEMSQSEDTVDISGNVTSLIIRQSSRREERANDQSGDDEEPNTTQQRRRNYEATLLSGRTLIVVGSNRNETAQISVQSMSEYRVPKNHRIHENVPRLTHYIEEPNVGKGFIKELCFSADGRLICSPFGYGVRFLSFSPECSELSTCVPKDKAVKLYEIGTNVCHRDIVVSTKFSPKHCLLVSGCLNGRICWHQPVL